MEAPWNNAVPREPRRPWRVVIVDDHPLLREGVRGRLELEPDFEFAGECETAGEATTLILDTHPDAALLDLALKDGSGLVLLDALRQRFPAMSIVVLSSYDESIYAERAIHAGAMGYVMKTAGTARIIDALRATREGRVYLSADMDQRLRAAWRGLHSPKRRIQHTKLSDREIEVLRLLGNGKSNTEIAHALPLAGTTVETYKSRLKEKLGLRSTGELRIYSTVFMNDYPLTDRS